MSKSEDVLGSIFDSCMADAAVKVGAGKTLDWHSILLTYVLRV